MLPSIYEICHQISIAAYPQIRASNSLLFGFAPDEVETAIEKIGSLDGVSMCGLMTMAPIQQYDGQAQQVFADTYTLFNKLAAYVPNKDCWKVLSMGMSQDYRYAIKEGATHIRIGTSIFGDRSKYLS